MSILKLRNHIPISGPARREPADGTESDMRVSLGFVPAWFYQRCGVDFTERWHQDPFYRYNSLVKMKKELCKAFPSISYWSEDYKDDLATISGCYGAYVIPKVFGFFLLYKKDRWPEIDKNKEKLSVKEVEELNTNNILSSSFTEEIFHQMDIIEAEWGKIHGYLNWQGVLNNAFHLRGENIFTDFYDKPDLVHHFLSVITDVIIRLTQKVQKRQRKSGFYVNHFCVSNCTVNMVSPQIYREFLLPYDKKIAESSFERFGMHTCNWNITPYLEEIKKIPKVGYLDMGIMSDMKKVKKMFPGARRAVMYSPVRLQEASLNEIKKDMEKIYNELSPCDIVMADIQATTSDERVNELLQICRDLEMHKK
ncbi:MAG: uroporphyrinogen decarboxylase family protein [Candidatus Caldatribacteriota bacterium]|nr:uroporphyrinogen decarboxylase family protein [Candidatus Caldatribacteriota bacterium]